MINIAIESIKLLLNEINTNENKNVFNIIIMIREDALLSKGTSNEEMGILTTSPGHIHGNYFCWGFTASFIACI